MSPFQAHRGAWFFEINAHDHEETVVHFGGEGGYFARVFAASFEVVNGAGTNDKQEARVVAKDDFVDGLATFGNEAFVGFRAFDLRCRVPWCRQKDFGGNVDIR